MEGRPTAFIQSIKGQTVFTIIFPTNFSHPYKHANVVQDSKTVNQIQNFSQLERL